MNNTGIIRRVDELGRIVIPIEIRNSFNIKEKDTMEIYIDKDSIILKKNEERCIICKSDKNLLSYKNKLVCKTCIKEMQNVL